MIDRARRDALAILGAMGSAAALGLALQPPAPDSSELASVDLGRVVPQQFGDWRIDESSLAFVRPTLRQGQNYTIYDQVLERIYVDDKARRIMLSVAHGSRQTATLQLHRPEVCYRAGGYKVHAVHAATLTLADQPLPVTRLRAEMPDRKEPITYWTLIGGEVVADSSSFAWRRLSLLARRRVVDGMLVRVSSISADSAAAFELHAQFCQSLVTALALPERALFVGPPAAGAAPLNRA
jgi:EpsI family protein